VLLDKGADPNAKAEDGQTPLSVGILGAPGGPSERSTAYGRLSYTGCPSVKLATPLVFQILRLLLDKGADPLLYKSQALRMASYRKNPELLRTLLESHERARGGLDDALGDAVGKGDDETAAILLEHGASADMGLLASVGPLAVHAGMAKQMLDAGAAVEARDKEGNTALILAASRNRTEVVRLLLERGADVNAANEEGHTALTLAAFKGHDDAAALLLEHGADVNARAARARYTPGATALIYAAYSGESDLVTRLLEGGADIDAQAKEGYTALMMAACIGQEKAAAVLIEKGADLSLRNGGGETASETARRFGKKNVSKLLDERG
jgi:ankyrin repeat protein